MDWNDLKSYIGSRDAADDELIKNCFDDAVLLIDLQLVNAFRPCPDGIRKRMVLEVGNELFNRKNAPGAQSMYTQFDGSSVPVRAPRDPLTQVRPILAMFVVPF